jgi:hypothetical protein
MEHEFSSHDGIVSHQVHGRLGFSQFKHLQQTSYEPMDAAALTAVLWDLGDSNLLWSYAEIVEDDRPFMSWLADKRPVGRTAFVTQSEVNRVLLKQLHDAHTWTTQWQFFDDRASAVHWLQAILPARRS